MRNLDGELDVMKDEIRNLRCEIMQLWKSVAYLEGLIKTLQEQEKSRQEDPLVR
jgi:predicted  nucleic acid-binding Zn-ribbon protein